MNIEQTCDGPTTLVIDSVKDPKAVQKREARLKREAKIEEQRMASKKAKEIEAGPKDMTMDSQEESKEDPREESKE